MTVLELKAQHDALQKIATTRDPVRALAEFVWNALDADARQVAVELERNALGGVEAITIRDDGNGISRERALADFENLGASWKRTRQRTRLNRVLHGKEGQGRLRFFSVAQRARWCTVYEDGDALKKLSIEITSGSLHKSEVNDIELAEKDTATGTIIELSPLKDSFDWLTGEEARTDFAAIFAPYILQYPDVVIVFDGHLVDPAATVAHSKEFPAHSVICPNRVVKNCRSK
jgi:hypothetical protein